ncbi:hypothetical protein TMatcc_003875 [Talaromyces marneffei ATCC 18224]
MISASRLSDDAVSNRQPDPQYFSQLTLGSLSDSRLYKAHYLHIFCALPRGGYFSAQDNRVDYRHTACLKNPDGLALQHDPLVYSYAKPKTDLALNSADGSWP